MRVRKGDAWWQENLPGMICKYQTGETLRSIAKFYGLSFTTIQKRLKPHIEPRTRQETGKLRTDKTIEKLEDRVVSDYSNGKSMAKIAYDLHASGITIAKVLQKRNISLRPHNEYCRTAPVSEIIGLIRTGLRVKEIAEQLGYTNVGSVYCTLHKAGIKIRQIRKEAGIDRP